jgi:uncharacterized membrane protein
MFNKHRLEALSDAVFAIVMTLLVLDLKVPAHIPPGGLGVALLQDSHAWFSFALTFCIAAIFWTFQHRVFDLIENTGSEALFLTFVFLGFVSLLPFSTSLIGQQSVERIAFVLYFSNQFAIAFALTLKMEVAHHRGHLHDGVDALSLRFQLYRICLVMGAGALSAGFAPLRYFWVAPAAVAVLGRLTQRLLRWLDTRKQKHRTAKPLPAKSK